MLERQIDKLTKQGKGDKSALADAEVLKKVCAELTKGVCARNVELSESEAELLRTVPLLSGKPVIYCANVSEDDLARPDEENEYFVALKNAIAGEDAEIISVCAETEAALGDLDKEEQEAYLAELGVSETGLDKLIKASYALLGLISFLTAGEPEVRAWTITRGMKAPQAAGKIHSDFERGFIRAEVIHFDDLVACKTMVAAKEKGLVRSEGKEYVVRDGDIILFRFNV